MRLVAAAVLIGQAAVRLRAELPVEAAIIYALASIAGVLLFVGLWTPISGFLVAAFELWSSFSEPGDPWAKILLGTLGLGLALLGPGAVYSGHLPKDADPATPADGDGRHRQADRSSPGAAESRILLDGMGTGTVPCARCAA